MPRSRGAVNRAHCRITDRAAFKAIVRRTAARHGGQAALAASLGVSKALVTNWRQGTRSGIAPALAERLLWHTHDADDATRLLAVLAAPADGRGLWGHNPGDGRDDYRAWLAEREAVVAQEAPAILLEQAIGEVATAAVVRGRRPRIQAEGRTRTGGDPLARWPLWRPVLVPVDAVERVLAWWVGGIEMGEPVETPRGLRVPVVLAPPPP